MVHLMKSGNLRPEIETTSCRSKVPVKLEIEDSLEDEHGPDKKRSKTSSIFEQPWSSGTNAFPIPPSQYNPLDEPSPLGLRLKKSPSLLDLIQMRLSQGGASSREAVKSENLDSGVKKEGKGTGASSSVDKLKASNFPASLLRIGRWEYKSKHEGDLVAKCYFAKHKLVWEVLEGGLKSKIEIQWSDIMALKADCPDEGPGTLNIMLARQPLFFRETNPQPRKHTLWQATSDFTDGQASLHRQHFLQCPQGLLNKHFEKLIQCDMRLNFLSRQPEIVSDLPYFESHASVIEDPEEPERHGFEQMEDASKGSALSSCLQIASSPDASQSSSFIVEQQDSAGIALEHRAQEAPSPSSVTDTCPIERNGNSEAVNFKGLRNWEDIKVPGIHPSMSMSDLVNHIGNCITEQITAGNPHLSEEGSECRDVLEEIADYLLSDTQLTTDSDEKSLMSRVNSLCCLLQKDPTSTQNLQVNGEGLFQVPDDGNIHRDPNTSEPMLDCKTKVDFKASEGESINTMSRKDSFSDLLLHLPQIASLPKFLFNISEDDGEGQAR